MREQSSRLVILDTTLRDGEQMPGVNLNIGEKLEIARYLEALGVDYIEAGFPAASQGDFEAVKAVAGNVECGVAALCRCLESDIKKGWQAISLSKKPRLHVFIASSELHMKYKLKIERDEALRRAVESVALAKSLCDDVEFSCEDASRSDPAFLFTLIEAAIKAGANTINIPDTVGYAMPGEYGALIRDIAKNVPNISRVVISAHCHNDLGLATANTLAAVENGARQIEATINGLGERAGNCPMEEVVMALATRASYYKIRTGIDATKIYRTSQRVSKLTGVPVPECKAVVGANAFTHKSGIHQHGMLSNPMTYEIMTPQSVGKNESVMVLGKLSGRHAFAERLRGMGFEFGNDEIDSAFVRFKELADRKKDITEDDLEALVNNLDDMPGRYRLESFQIHCGNKTQSTANIVLMHEGEISAESATGDGPVDAAYNAVARIVGGQWPLVSYDIKAVGAGMDALGEVTVRVRFAEEIFVGRGLSTDIIEASVLAFINAINKAVSYGTCS